MTSASGKIYAAVFLILIVAGLALFIGFEETEIEPEAIAQEESRGGPPGYTHNRAVRYSFTVRNKTSQVVEQGTVRIHAPVSQTSFQRANSITASHDFKLEQDELGNRVLVFELDMAPLATRVITISAQLDLSETPNPLVLDDSSIYLRGERYIEIDDENIRALSSRLEQDGSTDQLKNAYEWVSSNVSYAGYIEADRGAAYALNQRQGDCTEYTYLFTALARLQGVPTRGVGGFVVAEDSVLKARDFHNWAEVYVDGSWRPVDPQNKTFMQNENHFIVLRILSEAQSSSSASVENTHRIAHVTDGLEVRMN